MSATRPWFRMYARFITDPVVEELSFEDQRHFVFLLCMKCDGLLDKDFSDPEMRERAIARRLGLQGEALINAKDRLRASGLVDAEWHPVKWDELQFQSDTDPTAADRKRRQRERESVTRDVSRDVTRIDQSRADTEQNRTEQSAVTPQGEMAIALRNLGVAVKSTDPVLHEWLKLGITTQQAVDAVGMARIRKPHPEAIPANYLDKILRQPARPPPENRRPMTAHERLMEATK